MFRSVLEDQAVEVERQALALASAVDPDAVASSEAVRLYERLDRAGRAIAAAKTLLARRVDDSLEWKRRGYRSSAELLAATAGTSLGAAREELDTSTALADLAGTRAALVNGTGCSRTIIEYDHVYGAEFKDTRHTRLDETRPTCPGHHDLHTHHGWAMIRGPGKQPMVPPDHPLHPANGRSP